VVVGDEFRDGTLERGSPNQDPLIRADFGCESDPSFRESGQVGRSGRPFDGFDYGSTQDQDELSGEHLAAVVDELECGFDETVDCVGEFSCDLLSARFGEDSGDVDWARCHTNDEVDRGADQSSQGPYLHGDEIRCRQYVPVAFQELPRGALPVSYGR
jgi:hypothetical protein